MENVNQKLNTQSAFKSFFQYLVPTLIGNMLMSINIVIDGIFVGNGVGSTALASVNLAVPVWSIIISMSLLIGLGGGTLYSIAMGRGETDRAKLIFTVSTWLIIVITMIISGLSILFMEPLAHLFGANAETLPYAIDYMTVLFYSALIIALEVVISIFIRNDGDPKLAMMGLVAAAVTNIGLNYWMIFILEWEVKGAAVASVIATAIGLLIYSIHFLKKGSGLRFVPINLKQAGIASIIKIGFPGFLSEAGMGIFVLGYNMAMAYYIGTNGVAAFSIINYLHAFMFLAFLGIGSTIQPMVSFYYGAKKPDMIKSTIRISEVTALLLGGVFIVIGYFGADWLVSFFGVASAEIGNMAGTGIKLFFLGYLFMGINFIYMTYYQSIGYIKPSVWITLFRGVFLLILMLLVLPVLFGINGIWLSLPIAEALVAVFLIAFARKGVMEQDTTSRGF